MLDATDLLEMFSRVSVTRSSGNEAIDAARIANADFEERCSLDRLRNLRGFWARLYGKRNAQ